MPGPAINELIAMVTVPSGLAEYYHTDHHGSVVATSRGDNGNIRQGPVLYDAYGNCFVGAAACTTLGATANPFLYTGMYLDQETGLFYDRARSYSSTLGRFAQTDPVGYDADLNLYLYGENDPVNETDPSGRNTYMVSRPVIPDDVAFKIATAAGLLSERMVPGSGASAAAATYQQAKSFMHSFLVVTNGSSDIQHSSVSATKVWDWGPSNSATNIGSLFDLGKTTFQTGNSPVRQRDLGTLNEIRSGTAQPGVGSSLVAGGSFNETSTAIFNGLAKVGGDYSLVPLPGSGQSNSNSAPFVGAEAAAAAAGTTFRAPPGTYTGANSGWNLNGQSSGGPWLSCGDARIILFFRRRSRYLGSVVYVQQENHPKARSVLVSVLHCGSGWSEFL